VAGTLVGDERAMGRSFGAEALKKMAVNMVGHFMALEASEVLGSAPDLKSMTPSDIVGQIAIETAIKGTLNTAVFGQEPGEAYKEGATSAVAGTIGRCAAAHIGEAREALGGMLHKVAHGLVGAGTGALLSHDDPARGALSGAVGAVAAEVIAEALTPTIVEEVQKIDETMEERLAWEEGLVSPEKYRDIRADVEQEIRTDLTTNVQAKARLLTALSTALMGLNPEIADHTAERAVENNWVHLALMTGFSAWAVYDSYTVYRDEIKLGHSREQAALAVMKHLGYEVAIGIAGGKVIAVGSKLAAPTVKAAWSHVLAENPALGLLLRTLGDKASAVGVKLAQMNQAGEAFIIRHWGKLSGKAETSVTAGAVSSDVTAATTQTGGVLSLVGKSLHEQQVAKVLSQQLRQMPEMAGLMNEGTVRQVVKEIGIKSGKRYHPSYVRNQTLGWIAEKRGMKTLERAGYEVIESKLPGNKGFDAIGIKRAANGEVQDIMILESKFSAKGGVKLARYKGGRGGTYQQMSDEWIRGVLDRMKRSRNEELRKLSKLVSRNESIVKRQINVLDQHGKTMWFPDKIPSSEVFK
jgi:hypothetical protein